MRRQKIEGQTLNDPCRTAGGYQLVDWKDKNKGENRTVAFLQYGCQTNDFDPPLNSLVLPNVLSHLSCFCRKLSPAAVRNFFLKKTTNMTVTATKILTTDTVPKYLEERWDEITQEMGTDSLSLDGVEVKAIQGGNVNYAFCIILQDGKTIFLKQVSPRKKSISYIGTRLYFAMLNNSHHPKSHPFLTIIGTGICCHIWSRWFPINI
jgi:hypothetical protein